MKQISTFVFLIVNAVVIAYGQDCHAPRYQQEVFTDIKFTQGVKFGESKKNMLGRQAPMLMDIYEPKDDTLQQRAMIMLVHGGNHLDVPVFNRKSPDIGTLAVRLAKRGFVVISPSYRLIQNLLKGTDEEYYTKAVLNAITDNHDAMCFMVNSFHNGNPYRIDIQKLFVGGVSSGAINAMNFLFLSDTSELGEKRNKWLREVEDYNVKNNNYTLTFGELLNDKYCSGILGAICLSGFVMDTNIIKQSDVAWYFSHGKDDFIAPFMAGKPLGLTTVPTVFGPGAFIEKLKNTNTIVKTDFWSNSYHPAFFDYDYTNIKLEDFLAFTSVEKLQEVAFDAYILDSTVNSISNFCFELMKCSDVATPVRQNERIQNLSIFPNPAKEFIRIDLPVGYPAEIDYQIYSTEGKIYKKGSLLSNVSTIDIRDLPVGVYHFRGVEKNINDGRFFTAKFQVQR